MVENCKVFAKHRRQRAEPLMPTPFPECPWQMIGMDLFELDNLNYLIAVSIKHGLRTTDCGLGIKYGLGIKRGLENTDWV